MQDLNHVLNALDQRATATVTINDYTALSGKNVVLDGTTKTEGTHWTAATSNDSTATSLASALNGIAGFSASAVANVVTIKYTTPGTAGNSKTLTSNGAAAITLSGATLAGGVDATYTDALDLAESEGDAVQATLYVSALSGSGNIVVTPQFSYNKAIWIDDIDSIFKTLTAAGNSTRFIRFTGLYVRFKIVTSGTIYGVTGNIFASTFEGSKAAFFPVPSDSIKTGEIAGATSATVMPHDVPCKMVKFKASYDNAGRVYIGGAGVTVANGSSDQTTGLQLSAGEETGWLFVSNINQLYRICDNAGDDLTYIAHQ